MKIKHVFIMSSLAIFAISCAENSIEDELKSGKIKQDEVPAGGNEKKQLLFRDAKNEALDQYWEGKQEYAALGGSYRVIEVSCYDQDMNRALTFNSNTPEGQGKSDMTEKFLKQYEFILEIGPNYAFNQTITKGNCTLKRTSPPLSKNNLMGENSILLQFPNVSMNAKTPQELGVTGNCPDFAADSEAIALMLSSFNNAMDYSVSGRMDEILFYSKSQNYFCSKFANNPNGVIVIQVKKRI